MPRSKKETESTLKAAIMKRLRAYKGVVVFRLEDTATSGIPDIVVTAGGKTTWWEVKFGNPNWESKGIQETTMLALEANGFARYIIYRQTADRLIGNVSIVRPSLLHVMERWETVEKFNHDWVVQQILGAHR